MTLRNYQKNISLANLYELKLSVASGLGESLSPRISSVGGDLTLYASEEQPTGLTLANIATKMSLIGDDVVMEAFISVPRYFAAIQKSGTSTELVITCIDIEEDLGAIS